MANESRYKKKLRKKLLKMFPGCVIFKNDAGQLQGVPDMLILYRNRWAMLEVKDSATAKIQPNQPYYVHMFNQMSFAAFIYPENEEVILDALQQSFKSGRPSRVSEPIQGKLGQL